MNDFVFQNTTKIYFGKNQLHHLSEEINQFGSKVLLVYGGGSIKKIGLYDKVTAELKKASMTVFKRINENFASVKVILSEFEIQVIDNKLDSMDFMIFGGH